MYITYFPLSVKNTAHTFSTIRLRFVYDTWGNQTKPKPNQNQNQNQTKTKPKLVVVVIEEFLIEEFLIEEFNRLILCSGIFSVYLGSISDILGFISDRYLYKA